MQEKGKLNEYHLPFVLYDFTDCYLLSRKRDGIFFYYHYYIPFTLTFD